MVRRGLHELASKKIDFTTLETEADKDDGIFGDPRNLQHYLCGLCADRMSAREFYEKHLQA